MQRRTELSIERLGAADGAVQRAHDITYCPERRCHEGELSVRNCRLRGLSTRSDRATKPSIREWKQWKRTGPASDSECSVVRRLRGAIVFTGRESKPAKAA
jgi:hypothetical protein